MVCQLRGGRGIGGTYIAGVVDEVVDPTVDLEGLFGDLLEVGQRGCHVKRESGRAGVLEVGELCGVAGCGDDGVSAAECLADEGTAEARRATSNDPHLW